MPDGRTGEAMTSDVLFNPTITRQAAAVRARALDPNAPLPPLDPRVQAYLTPDAAVLEASIREREGANCCNLRACVTPHAASSICCALHRCHMLA